MLHPSTKKLIDRLIEMTELGKLKWEEGTDDTLFYSTEGYSVSVVGAPHEILISSREGAELERATATELAETLDEEGVAYTDLVARMVKEASRYARGTETAISSLLADINRVNEEVPATQVETTESSETVDLIALTTAPLEEIAEEAHLTDETTAIDATEIAALEEAAEVSDILETADLDTEEIATFAPEPIETIAPLAATETAETTEPETLPDSLEVAPLEETSEEPETETLETESETLETAAEPHIIAPERADTETELTSEPPVMEAAESAPATDTIEPSEAFSSEPAEPQAEITDESADDTPNMTAAVARLAEEVNGRENSSLNFPVAGGLTAAAGGLATAVARAADTSQDVPEDTTPLTPEVAEASSEPVPEVTPARDFDETELSVEVAATEPVEAEPVTEALAESEPTDTVGHAPETVEAAAPLIETLESEPMELTAPAPVESPILPTELPTEPVEMEAETEQDPAPAETTLGADEPVTQTSYVPFGLEATTQEANPGVAAITDNEESELPGSDATVTAQDDAMAEPQLSEPAATQTDFVSPILSAAPETVSATDDAEAAPLPEEEVVSTPTPAVEHTAAPVQAVADLTGVLQTVPLEEADTPAAPDLQLAETPSPVAETVAASAEESPATAPDLVAAPVPETPPTVAPSFSLSGMQTGFGLTPLTAKTEVSGMPGQSSNAHADSAQKIIIDAVDEVRDSDIPGVSEGPGEVAGLSYPKEQKTTDVASSEGDQAEPKSDESAAPSASSDETLIKDETPSLAPRTRFNPWD